MFEATIKAAIKGTPLYPFARAVAWRLHVFQDWFGTKVWTRTRETTTPLGFRLTSGFHPAYAQMRAGKFEPNETAVLSGLLDETDVFIDVGANLGYYSLLSLQRGRRVVAFEPQPQNLRALYRNLESNGWQDRAEVFPIALSDKPGLLTLYGASGPSASLVKGWAEYSARYQRIVPVSTLDNILGGRFGGEKLLVKIDVEGAEFDVLQGALGTMMRDPKPDWLIEICLDEFHANGANPHFSKIFDLFFDSGYHVYAIGDQCQRVTQDDISICVRDGKTPWETFNYLFTTNTLTA